MRRPDWKMRLWCSLQAQNRVRFAWAGMGDAHDCCTFVAACVDAMTDSNYLEQVVANYNDEASALEYIKRNGGFQQTITKHLGAPIPVSEMASGDVALVRSSK